MSKKSISEYFKAIHEFYADDGGYQGGKISRDNGQEYKFMGYLNKGVLTVLGEVSDTFKRTKIE